MKCLFTFIFFFGLIIDDCTIYFYGEKKQNLMKKINTKIFRIFTSCVCVYVIVLFIGKSNLNGSEIQALNFFSWLTVLPR